MNSGFYRRAAECRKMIRNLRKVAAGEGILRDGKHL